jgi:type VI secretion system protein ImpK
MSTDDPFASFESDHTFVMPSPGQRPGRSAAASAQRGDAGGDIPVPVDALIPARSINPLIAAASPLLNAIPPLRASLDNPDPAALRDRLADGIRAFERKAHETGVEQRKITAARYVLCTFLDETVTSTPWGGSGAWARLSLLVMFHNETWGGEKVFQLMAKLAENPAANLDLLEFLHVVLALGFEGRFRVQTDGAAQLGRLRERLHTLLREQRGAFERELSPHWAGQAAARHALAQFPVWIMFALAGVLAVGLFLFLSSRLASRSDPLFADVLALRSAAPAPPPVIVAPPPAPRARLATFLEPEIRAGQVVVLDLDDRSVVTIRGDGTFRPGSASVEDAVLPLLRRIGEALNEVPGAVLVTGHTDNLPIRSARFPSNWHLSIERAESVRGLLARTVDPGRLKAEGRADAEPVAGNATPADRARNRRVEITLYRAGT